MQVPISVSFKGLPVSETVRTACWNEVEKLERYCRRITGCHVTVARSHRHRQGNHFDIHCRLVLPRQVLVVSRAPAVRTDDEDPALAVHEAFGELRRRLQDHLQRRRENTRRGSTDTRAATGPRARGDRGDGERAIRPSPSPRLRWPA